MGDTGLKALYSTEGWKMKSTRNSMIRLVWITPMLFGLILVGWSISGAENNTFDETANCDCGRWGDVNGDNAVNPVDVTFMVNYVYLGRDMLIQPPNCPFSCGDVNCDAGLNPVDVTFYVNYVYLGKDMFCADPCDPSGSLVGTSGCKSFQEVLSPDIAPPDQDCLEYQYDGESLLLLKHLNAGFNCCPEIATSVSIEGNVITIEEIEIAGYCDCLCLFDLDYEIVNLPPAEYTITVIEPYVHEGQEILEFSVDLVSSPSGIHCVHRDNYPWGN